MTTVSRPNRDALNQALDIYRDAMRPFIVRNLRSVQGGQVSDLISRSLKFRTSAPRNLNDLEAEIDINDFPLLIKDYWRSVFSAVFASDMTVQNALWQIKEARNKAAHPSPQDIDPEFTRAHLFHISDVLGKMNLPLQKQAVEDIRERLFSSPAPVTPSLTEPEPEADTEPVRRQPRPSGDLTPWRDVIQPNADVSLGTFQESEFAANLQQVHDGRADATQYGNPVSFFEHTYITPGIRTLLLNTLKRLAGNGGDPVIQTKTGFGGGKTHSLIALYHLVNNMGALTNPAQVPDSQQTSSEIRAIVEEAGLDPDQGIDASVAVLVGTYLSPTDTNVTENGDPLNTLWGEMAYQLGGPEAYDIIGDAARQGVAPGERQLNELFRHVGPCVILIDELVAYVRNAGDAQDNIYTFIQNLTESVSGSGQVALVVTLPENAAEAGGDTGLYALSRLDSILGRIEAIWEPLEVNEAFEVVRRRLFGTDIDETERDRVCEAFSRIYSRSRRDYPQEVGEQNYLEHMKACYPIHPEIFDRLYSDWSAIHRFQRTRGVLRMLAHCVSRLYLDGDASPLIMPANLPLDDPGLSGEFISILGEQWRPVLTEADSDGSRTDMIDRSSQRFGRFGVSRRLARAIILGSAPGGAVSGIDATRIHLGVVQPGHGESVYNEALNRMARDLYYLYSADGRYYFHVEENLNKVATDRADSVTDREIHDEIESVMKEAVGRRSDVIIFPRNSAEVPDAESARLVILPPDKSLSNRASEPDDATPEAKRILSNRGDVSRVRKNTLLFLAARKDEVRNLYRAVRNYLAWTSIHSGDRRIENLGGDRQKQVVDSVRQYASEVRSALVNAYRWAMAPYQPDPQNSSEFDMNPWPISAQDTGQIIESAFAKFIEEEALVASLSPAALQAMLQQYIWKSNDHITIEQLWDIMTANVYMHRLTDKAVLVDCIRRGVPEAAFGYAQGYNADADTNPYGDDMRFAEPMDGGLFGIADPERGGLLVSPEMARIVKEEIAKRHIEDDEPDTPIHPTPGVPTVPPDTPTVPGPATPTPPAVTQIVVNQTFQSEMDLNDISLINEEIIRNLKSEGVQITVSVTVSATKQDGFSENIARSIRENSVQLGLDLEQI